VRVKVLEVGKTPSPVQAIGWVTKQDRIDGGPHSWFGLCVGLPSPELRGRATPDARLWLALIDDAKGGTSEESDCQLARSVSSNGRLPRRLRGALLICG